MKKLKEYIKNILGIRSLRKIFPFTKKMEKLINLKEIIIDISAACNAKCPFCPRNFMPNERKKGFMELSLLKKIIYDAKENKVNTVRLYATAEPTLHPEFDKIVDLIKSMGFIIHLSTNASLLNKHFETLSKIDLIQFSIEGWDKESYEKYRYPLKFEVVYENIKNFSEFISKLPKKPHTQINLLITKRTQLKKFVELWGPYVDEIRIYFAHPPLKFSDGVFKAIQLDEKEYFKLKKINRNFYCYYPFNVLTVAYDGKVALCCADFSAGLELGDLNYQSIKEVFYSEKLKRIREQFLLQKLNVCAECGVFTVPYEEDINKINQEISEIDNDMRNKIKLIY
jgi:MoaA/NifB/PqqE/SkfB family radical SAM enzyme